MSDGFSKTLAISHMVVGVASLVGPLATADLFGIAPARSTSLITRLFGSRDLVLGWSILYTARDVTAGGQKLALMAANAINAIDVLSSIVDYYQGTIGQKALALGAGGAFFLFSLGYLSYRSQGFL